MVNMHLIYSVADCNDWEDVGMYHENYSYWNLPCHSESMIVWSWFAWTCPSLILVTNEQLRQFVQKKAFPKNISIILQQAHKLYSETLIAPSLLSFAMPPSIGNGRLQQIHRICAVVLQENIVAQNLPASVLFNNQAMFSLEYAMNATTCILEPMKIHMLYIQMLHGANLHLTCWLAL